MEVKKARRADLEKGKSRWLFMGFIVTLSFMFVSFEWTERNVTYAISDLVSDPDFFEELVPVTYNQDKPLPPPPPPAAVTTSRRPANSRCSSTSFLRTGA